MEQLVTLAEHGRAVGIGQADHPDRHLLALARIALRLARAPVCAAGRSAAQTGVLAMHGYGHVFSACLMTLRAAWAATVPRLLPAFCEAVQLLQNSGRSLTKSPNS